MRTISKSVMGLFAKLTSSSLPTFLSHAATAMAMGGSSVGGGCYWPTGCLLELALSSKKANEGEQW
jgi:hypothetical protein